MKWPGNSPDLKPMKKNILANKARDVHKTKRQFYSTEELKNAKLISWSNIDSVFFQNLVKSGCNSCIRVIKHKRCMKKFWARYITQYFTFSNILS